MTAHPSHIVSDLSAWWMPFTANRQFKNKPRLLAKASGMYYETPDGRRVLDGVAGLWCVNAGHGRKEITRAVAEQLEVMDYAPPFQMGHPAAFELAQALVKISPAGIGHVFFTNSGSESVDTALKIALAYHRAKGDAGRTRLLGRERGYHGVGFGGISVGGMVANRKAWPTAMIPGVDHLRHTHDPARNAFSRGLPAHGAECAQLGPASRAGRQVGVERAALGGRQFVVQVGHQRRFAISRVSAKNVVHRCLLTGVPFASSRLNTARP